MSLKSTLCSIYFRTGWPACCSCLLHSNIMLRRCSHAKCDIKQHSAIRLHKMMKMLLSMLRQTCRASCHYLPHLRAVTTSLICELSLPPSFASCHYLPHLRAVTTFLICELSSFIVCKSCLNCTYAGTRV